MTSLTIWRLLSAIRKQNISFALCLKAENGRLEKMLLSTKSELEDAKEQATANQIIPHYRFAITRSNYNCIAVSS
jgi:hypothetical protein